jgi:hypothetical protein
MDVSSPSDSQVTLSYRGSNNYFVVTNEALTNDYAAPADIGVAAARALFTSAMNSAVSAGIVPATGLLASNARISRAVQGEGAIGQQPVEKTAEYVFSVPRTINGIEVLDAGFEVSVHRNGHLARVKTYGPTVGSTVDSSGNEVPNSKGYAFAPSVPANEIHARVHAEYPGAIVKSIGLRYWLPPGHLNAVTEPKQMYFVVPTAKVDGQQVHARGFYAAYSLSVSGAPATVSPQPAHNPVGNGQK